MRSTIPERFLIEYYKKQERFYVINDYYYPNYNRTLISRKFYSPHEILDLSSADPKYYKKVISLKQEGPVEKYPWPLTENQCYGWFHNLSFPKDEQFNFPRHATPEFKHEMKVQQEMATFPKPKFQGVPFHL